MLTTVDCSWEINDLIMTDSYEILQVKHISDSHIDLINKRDPEEDPTTLRHYEKRMYINISDMYRRLNELK